MKVGEGGRFRAIWAGWALALLLVSAGAGMSRAAELTFDIRVENGRVADDKRLIRVKEGDVVRLRWTSDRPLVLHLHGYDIERHIAAGQTAELSFTARATGRFPIHVHAAGERGAGHADEDTPLAVLEVYPR
jgi:hypothetical protein